MGSEVAGGQDASVPTHRGVALVGLAIWFLGLVGLGWLWLVAPTQATAAAVAVATFYYAGQFGAIPLGLALGGHPALIGLYVWAADAAGLLVFFPLTQLSIDRLARRPGRVAAWIRGLQGRAQRRERFIQRYGPWALYAFTSLPFLFNSPILGAVLGKIAGFRARTTLTALLSAITIMSVVWTFVFYRSIEEARNVDERLPWVLGLGSVAITFAIAGAAALVRTLRPKTTPTPVSED